MVREKDSSIARRDRKLPQRESRMDILESILKNSNKGSKDARLRYKCNLNLSTFNLYKDFLIETGFLKVSGEDGLEIFKTTDKGKQFLNDYRKIKSILDKISS